MPNSARKAVVLPPASATFQRHASLISNASSSPGGQTLELSRSITTRARLQRGFAPTVNARGVSIDGNSEVAFDTTTSFTVQSDEEAKQYFERQVRRVRQLTTREARQRSALSEEAVQQLDDILRRHLSYLDIAASCTALRAAREAEKQIREEQSRQWRVQMLADELCDLVDGEAVARRGVQHAEAAVRGAIAQLTRTERHGLAFHESIFRLIHAEQVRRAFVLREEARAVEAMGIPHFISLPCAAAAGASLSGTGKNDSRRVSRAMSKLDLMAPERCPFLCAAHCPYMHPRTRQLGERWAAALDRRHRRTAAKRGPGSGAHSAGGSLSEDVSEVGRQRVRNAMASEHYHDTPSFLPALRV